MRHTIFQTRHALGAAAPTPRPIGHIEAESPTEALHLLTAKATLEQLHPSSVFLTRDGIERRDDQVMEHLRLITWHSPIPDPWLAIYTVGDTGKTVICRDLLAPESPYLIEAEEEVDDDDRAVHYALATWITYIANQINPARREEWSMPTLARLSHRLNLPVERVTAALGRLASPTRQLGIAADRARR